MRSNQLSNSKDTSPKQTSMVPIIIGMRDKYTFKDRRFPNSINSRKAVIAGIQQRNIYISILQHNSYLVER